MGALIPAAKLPKAPDCFDIFFVIEHYGEETESPNISDYGMRSIYMSQSMDNSLY